MSKAIALHAFNAAVAVTNVAHGAKRQAIIAKNTTVDAGSAFWAGMKYAHAVNKADGARAAHLEAKDVVTEAELPKTKRRNTKLVVA